MRPSLKGIHIDPKGWERRTFWCDGPNLRDGGIADLFLNQNTEPHAGWFLWPCADQR